MGDFFALPLRSSPFPCPSVLVTMENRDLKRWRKMKPSGNSPEAEQGTGYGEGGGGLGCYNNNSWRTSSLEESGRTCVQTLLQTLGRKVRAPPGSISKTHAVAPTHRAKASRRQERQEKINSKVLTQHGKCVFMISRLVYARLLENTVPSQPEGALIPRSYLLKYDGHNMLGGMEFFFLLLFILPGVCATLGFSCASPEWLNYGRSFKSRIKFELVTTGHGLIVYELIVTGEAFSLRFYCFRLLCGTMLFLVAVAIFVFIVTAHSFCFNLFVRPILRPKHIVISSILPNPNIKKQQFVSFIKQRSFEELNSKYSQKSLKFEEL